MTPYKFLQLLRFGKSESSQTNCQKYGQQGPSTLMILTPYKIPSLFKFWGKENLNKWTSVQMDALTLCLAKKSLQQECL
jgi:hypothetical protein